MRSGGAPNLARPGFIAAAINDELAILARLRRAADLGLLAIDIAQPRDLGVAGGAEVGQQSDQRVVAVEVGEIEMHLNLRVPRQAATIPEIRKLQLPRGFGKGRVEHQPNGEKQIALADAVLAQQHDIAGERDIDRRKISEVANVQLC